MKRNGNDGICKDYYIGLDIGTNSVGYAVTDQSYVLKKYAGNGMWGVRLFDEGETAEERRLHRTYRRRLSRRKWRLKLLEQLFEKELYKVDHGFLMRLEESFLKQEDRESASDFLLFNDKNYTDRDYHRDYKTIYHLRNKLIKNDSPHDIRLVYLALHHIIKSRGHFLFDIGDTDEAYDFENLFSDFIESFENLTEKSFFIKDKAAFHKIMLDKKMGISQKGKELAKLISISKDGQTEKRITEKIAALLAGSKGIKLSDIFTENSAYKEYSVSLTMKEEDLEELSEKAGDDFELIIKAKKLYDFVLIENINNGYSYISEYKIKQYEEHEKDLRTLKDYVKYVLCDKALKYEIFSAQKEKLCNYVAYSGHGRKETKSCSQADFCAYLKKALGKRKNDLPEYIEMYARIEEGIFAPKLRTFENGIIPNGLHRKELIAILDRAKKYLPFLNEKDENGMSVSEKIISIFDFRIPYYVGPLNTASDKHWVVRKEGKIYPWNFFDVVDEEGSQNGFIERMTSKCTYTGENVLPKDSLLYSEFCVLNEINNIKINGNPITVDTKKKIYEALFVNSSKKVTKKSLDEFLRKEGLICHDDIISGINDVLTSSLNSYHKLKRIIEKTSTELTEEIIRQITLFGESKKLLKKWLKKNTDLSEEDIAYVLKLKFKEWGRLSAYFLTEIVHVDEDTGEAFAIMDRLRNTNENLMQLLSSKYSFLEQASAHKKNILTLDNSPRSKVDHLYVSPKIRRSIWQALRIVDEIVDNQKGAPKKIFIEVARDKDGKNEKKMKDSRKEKLLALYKACKEDSGELFEALNQTEESALRSDKLFLYYSQFGKCMYSGKPIHIDDLSDNRICDIDHIFPRSLIKDDSLDNRVLVKANLNREKTNKYPISYQIQKDMIGFWKCLFDKGLITERKYERLTRPTELTEEELSSFVNRQLVETRQSSKAVAEILKEIYPETKIVYSKADNVSEFRQTFDLIKCRDINDHHHAKDAYLNIVVGNYHHTRFTEQFFKNIKGENYTLRPDKMYKEFNVDGAWQSGDNGTIAIVRKTMNKNNVLYSRMPISVKGQLYDLQLLRAGKGQVAIKQGLDTEKYGGYNKATGTYFALVEHKEKGQAVRTLESVYLIDLAKYESDPDRFAKVHWYSDAKVIIPQILIGSLLEIEGVRLNISGRSEPRVLFNHAHQLVVSYEDSLSIKAIAKYIERCNAAKKELYISGQDGISIENNIRLYDMLSDKIRNSIYGKLFENMLNDMDEGKKKFVSMSVLEQCKLLMEILKAFKCDAQHPSFKELNGKGSVAGIKKNKKISSYSSVYLIHQSASGLYEKKIDLLK